MLRQEADSLTEFINRSGDLPQYSVDPGGRFRAEMLPMGERVCWVILTDLDTGRSAEPLVDISDYLDAFSGQGDSSLENICCRLTLAWLATESPESSDMPDMPDLSNISNLSNMSNIRGF